MQQHAEQQALGESIHTDTHKRRLDQAFAEVRNGQQALGDEAEEGGEAKRPRPDGMQARTFVLIPTSLTYVTGRATCAVSL